MEKRTQKIPYWLFYWAWFITWAPFVGVFVARISKGHTIREFILGLVLVPALASCVWGSVFGSLGINLGEKGIMAIDELQEAMAAPEVGLFVVLSKYPIGFLLSIVAIISLCAFFVTSANSGVYVLSMLTTKGDINPPNSKKILWGIIQSVMAERLKQRFRQERKQSLSRFRYGNDNIMDETGSGGLGGITDLWNLSGKALTFLIRLGIMNFNE